MQITAIYGLYGCIQTSLYLVVNNNQYYEIGTVVWLEINSFR